MEPLPIQDKLVALPLNIWLGWKKTKQKRSSLNVRNITNVEKSFVS
jgi:hypothetical protein